MTNNIPDWLEKRRKNTPVFMGIPSRREGEYDSRLLLADVAFNRHSMNDGHHVSPFDNNTVQVGTDGIEVELVQGIDIEQFKKTLSMATRATIGVDIETGEKDNRDWEEMLKGGLQTALETQVIVFAVKGASRTCTHQLVRSRRAAFHQQSQRASYLGDIPECRMPESVWRNPVARQAFLQSTYVAHQAYRTICEQDISYQDARFVLPEGTTSFIMLEYPVREFLNVFAYRGCSMFQWEIVDVMRKCRDALVAQAPFMEPYVKITCEKTKVCEFQGWESVEGQCDFLWAREDNRRFQPEFHKIERKKS